MHTPGEGVHKSKRSVIMAREKIDIAVSGMT